MSCFEFCLFDILTLFFNIILMRKCVFKIAGITSSGREEESIGGLSAFRSVGKATKDGILGTSSAPIHMVATEGGHFKEQLWRTIRTIALAFLLISGVGALIEDRGISKGITMY